MTQIHDGILNSFIIIFLNYFQGPISVQMQLEISVQHHFIVAGKNSDNLRAIMKKTGTEVISYHI